MTLAVALITDEYSTAAGAQHDQPETKEIPQLDSMLPQNTSTALHYLADLKVFVTENDGAACPQP